MMFEESLYRTQEWLEGRVEKGILYRRELAVSDDTREQAGQAIRAALSLIQNLAESFALESQSEDASAIIKGELSESWANLLDTQAGKLRRYGAVHPDLSDLLDSQLQNLAGIALQLSAILGQTK